MTPDFFQFEPKPCCPRLLCGQGAEGEALVASSLHSTLRMTAASLVSRAWGSFRDTLSSWPPGPVSPTHIFGLPGDATALVRPQRPGSHTELLLSPPQVLLTADLSPAGLETALESPGLWKSTWNPSSTPSKVSHLLPPPSSVP